MIDRIQWSIAALVERFKMQHASHTSATNTKISSCADAPGTPSPTRKPSSRPSASSAYDRSPRNSSNRAWLHGRQRKAFLKHLEQWSLDHDSSSHFQGKISLLPQGSKSGEKYELGQSVHCILTDSSFPDARQKIVIRLFPPHPELHETREHEEKQIRRDSMEALQTEPVFSQPLDKFLAHSKVNTFVQEASPLAASRRYKLVVRCGAGWIPAREYLDKLYFSHLERRKTASGSLQGLEQSMEKRSQTLGPLPDDKDSVTIRPLFRQFLRLPAELQELVWVMAAGVSSSYNLCSDEYGVMETEKNHTRSPIPLATLFRVSKAINSYLVPHIYNSTDFQFGLTGYATSIVHASHLF